MYKLRKNKVKTSYAGVAFISDFSSIDTAYGDTFLKWDNLLFTGMRVGIKWRRRVLPPRPSSASGGLLRKGIISPS